MLEKKLKAIIVDDEQHCIDTLTWQIQEFCPAVEIIMALDSPVEAVDVIQQESPDLLFLDVEMPDMTGFELLNKVKSLNPKVIFTTAHDKFAVQAFKVSAVDYLVKPIDDDELQNAVKKVQQQQSRDNEALFEHLLNQIQGQKIDNRIYLPTLDGLEFVDSENIIRCESDSNYTTFYLRDQQKIVVSKTLKEVEELLDKKRFFRVHHSHIVNLDEVQKYVKGDGGHLVMKNREIVPVSRRRKQELLSFLR